MSKYILIAVVLILTSIQDVNAEQDNGYDVNTEVTLTGVVKETGVETMGPYVFTMTSGDKTYRVLTGPWWYLKQIGLSVKVGMTLEVTGSKFYDGKGILSIIAHSITEDSMTYKFRDEVTQIPAWHGRGRGGHRQ